MQLGLWRGDLTLQNLRLRSDALERLVLLTPLSVHEGSLGHIHLQVHYPPLFLSHTCPSGAVSCIHLCNAVQIPWGSLTTGRARLVVKGVRLCVAPRDIGLGPMPKAVAQQVHAR